MIQPTDLQARIDKLEADLIAERQFRHVREQQAARTQARAVKSLVAVIAVGSLVAGIQEARAWGGCAKTLPDPLKTFCAGDPALANDINGNFRALVDWLTPKVGAFGNAGGSSVAVFTGSGAALTSLSGSNITAGTVTTTALATTVVQSLVPPGTIIAYGGKAAPAGWLLCNGANLERALYPALFGAINTNFGTYDATHFNVPDLRGRFLRGWDNGAKRDPEAGKREKMDTGGATGDNVGSVQLDEFKSHTHNFVAMYQTYGNDTTKDLYERYGDYWTATTAAGGTETRPINANVNYIIKF